MGRGTSWRAAIVGAAMLAATPAWAMVPKTSGDLMLTYGRNLGQGLNVGGFAFEVKPLVADRLYVGVRPFLEVGAGVSNSDTEARAEAFFGLGATVKGEYYLSEERTRPYAGLGLGVEYIAAAGALASLEADSGEAAAWESTGTRPVIMPEVGVDLSALRLALIYRAPIGAKGSGTVLSANAQGESSSEIVDGPHLGGLLFQVGLHFGGPR